MIREGASVVVAMALLLCGSPAAADEGDELDRIVSTAVRANYESLHGCYRKQLALDRSKGGNLILRITLGPGDAVRSVAVAKDQLGNPEVAVCVTAWVRGWTLRGAAAAGAEPGSEVLLPIAFRAVPDQRAVRRDDARELPVEGGSARVLLTRKSAGAELASMTVLEVRGRMPLPGRAGLDQALYVLEGAGSLAGPAQGRSSRIVEGDAAWLGPGARVAVEGNLTLLLVLAPAGAEQVYLDRKPLAASGPGGPFLVVPRRKARPRRSGALSVTPLLHAGTLPHRRLYLGLLEARAGASLPAQPNASQAELLFVLSGEARASAGESAHRLGPAEAIYLPPAAARPAKIGSRPFRAVQVFVPGGPEDRFLDRGGK